MGLILARSPESVGWTTIEEQKYGVICGEEAFPNAIPASCAKTDESQ
jgi:hypothetical protein